MTSTTSAPNARPSILVVLGHPRSDSLCAAIADSYAAGARAAGADVTVLRLGETDFDLASRVHSLQRWLGPDQDPAREPEVEAMVAAVHAADHIVLVFPQWWGTYPAILKGWIDRVILSRSAFSYRSGSSLWDKHLTGRTARIIMTMDSPGWWDTIRYHRAAIRSLTHATLGYCGVRTIRTTRHARVRFSTPERRAAWIAQAERQGRADGARTPKVRRAARPAAAKLTSQQPVAEATSQPLAAEPMSQPLAAEPALDRD
ncbi:putative NADPH-quinone reductase [Flavimobilis soli]|uniref:Putative NADPH-quinone reductase n=1 Tax=Flavimobilis soli TaxID=442709 RepID=A0A2A9EDW6_9MICO|nr:NAD(P)H-dependent oxidoreductase [Flavimobilis soli]PFG37237.1 putative NADPH-quinone reductase [Flavimobilis soli]